MKSTPGALRPHPSENRTDWRRRDAEPGCLHRKSLSCAGKMPSPASDVSVVRPFGHSRFGWWPFLYWPRMRNSLAVCKSSGAPFCRSRVSHEVRMSNFLRRMHPGWCLGFRLISFENYLSTPPRNSRHTHLGWWLSLLVLRSTLAFYAAHLARSNGSRRCLMGFTKRVLFAEV